MGKLEKEVKEAHKNGAVNKENKKMVEIIFLFFFLKNFNFIFF
jgi:hypothetical protein